MITTLNKRAVQFKWIGPAPSSYKKVALLIPQYNESSNCNLLKRLEYFKKVAAKFKDEIDVIIIDDGSTDDGLEKINTYINLNPNHFFVASVNPNANKVGALYLTTLAIKHEYIILSDFDTDIMGLGEVIKATELLGQNSDLMGCYFRMLPFEGAGNVFQFQQIEYTLARSLYKFHEKDLSVPVMPGAGSCYKREILLSIFREHSGLRSGEDREATLIGLKLGYKTKYLNNVLTLTRPPLTYKALVKQRVRWNLGYLETFYKEKEYYGLQIKKMSRVGIRTLTDIGTVSFVLLLPIFLLALCLFDLFYLLTLTSGVYVAEVFWCFYLLLVSPKESEEIKSTRITAVLKFPFYKVSVEYFAWLGAIMDFMKKKSIARSNVVKKNKSEKMHEGYV